MNKYFEIDERFESRWHEAEAAKMIADAIRNMRIYRELTQLGLAELCGWDQSQVARMENPDYRGWTFKSLITIANALRCRLRVRYEDR